MNVLVLGGAGELGANFSKLCLDSGHNVVVLDVVRELEAWRLKELGIQDKVQYVWKSTFDLSPQDLENIDLIMDCACQADRPLGSSSPKHTLLDNLLGPLTVLETMKTLPRKPFLIYPSSGVEFLGVPREEQPITETTIPKPTNVYGYSKWMAEELYQTYRRSNGYKSMVIRTGSCYGPMMRSDQFIAQCIIKCLQNKVVEVRSPEATRTYTFTEDVLAFYRLLLAKFDSEKFNGLVIANSGNAENKPYTTLEVAQLIHQITGSQSIIFPLGYESGESLGGKPVFQWEVAKAAEALLGWKPKFSLKEGLEQTVEWWRKHV